MDVPASTPAAIPVPTPPSRAPSDKPAGPPLPVASSVGPDASPAFRVLGVAVEPARIAPGGEIAMVVTYSISNTAASSAVAVLERRTIAQQGKTLKTLEATVSRLPGTYESRQTLRIPADLAAGVYDLRVTVEVGGRTAQGSTIFQVI